MNKNKNIIKILIFILIVIAILILYLFYRNDKTKETVTFFYDIGNGPAELLNGQQFETEYNTIISWNNNEKKAKIKRDGIELEEISSETELIESGNYEIAIDDSIVKIKIQKNKNVSWMFNVLSNNKGKATLKFNPETVTNVIIYGPDGSEFLKVTDFSQEYTLEGKRGETYSLLINDNYRDSVDLR